MPIDTLEPFIDAVREGIEAEGWKLSGLQKTTSHHFEGRWAGDSTRSAYLFFHRDDRWEDVSIDVYLDETTRGLRGNLALVLDGRSDLLESQPREPIRRLEALCDAHLPDRYRRPVVVRFRSHDTELAAEAVEVEIRFKLHVPVRAIDVGAGAVSALASETTRAFEALLEDPALAALAFVR